MKKSGFALVVVVLGSLMCRDAAAEWYCSAWEHRNSVTIDSGSVNGATAHADFPFLVHSTNATLDIWSSTQSDGKDILFTTDDGVTKIPHEIEKYVATPGDEELWIWVKIPFLSPSSDTTIYMYYGNTNAADQQDAAEVWVSDYSGVWHMSETNRTDGAYNDVRDSSPYGNHGESQDNLDMNYWEGKIAGADVFELDNSNRVTILDDTSFNPASNLTISVWFKTDGDKGASYEGGLFGKRTDGGSATYDFYVYSSGYALLFFESGDTFTWPRDDIINCADGQWHQYVIVLDSSVDEIRLCIDGVVTTNTMYAWDGTIRMRDMDLSIGVKHGVPATECFDGVIDEVRMSVDAKSAAWAQTAYNNQNDPAAMIEFGETQVITTEGCTECTPLWYDGRWKYRQYICLSTGSISGTLTNFPLLVATTDSTLGVWSHAKNDGTDILFTLSDGETKLDHEIEMFTANPGSEGLWAWIRMPVLSAATNRCLYMYYGNGGASDQQAITSVWDSNYIMVQHLHETSKGAGGYDDHLDSTSHDNDGEAGGGVTMTAAGPVNGADSFDGDDDYIDLSDKDDFSFGDGVTDSPFTISTWLFIDDYNGENIYAVAKSSGDTTYEYTLIVKENFRCFRLDLWDESASGWLYRNGGSAIATGVWYHCVGTYDGAGSSAGLHIYVGGESADGGDAGSTFTAMENTACPLYFAAGQAGPRYSDCKLDEVRISDVVRSAGWIKTSYNNQSDPANFFLFGREWDYPVPGTVIMIR